MAAVNVYVPNESSGCSRLPYKAKFLAGLSRVMAQLKAEGALLCHMHAPVLVRSSNIDVGYSVVLLGDLNIARRVEVTWSATAAAAAASWGMLTPGHGIGCTLGASSIAH